jgi:hypothetical protein
MCSVIIHYNRKLSQKTEEIITGDETDVVYSASKRLLYFIALHINDRIVKIRLKKFPKLFYENRSIGMGGEQTGGFCWNLSRKSKILAKRR